MINNVYQLVAPKTLVVKFEDVDVRDKVVVRPRYLAICHADQRYYQGKRDPEAMRRKLPMALVHECMGAVVADPTGSFNVGDPVVLIPNIAGRAESGVYENYAEGSAFRSSGRDGFMRELVDLPPDRVVGCAGVDPEVAAITEFVSVAVHAVTRFEAVAHQRRDRIAVIGDGSMAYAVSCVLRALHPESSVAVIGRNADKLNLFTFVQERWLTSDVPDDLAFDHAFECAGGEGSAAAIDQVIAHIRPQGSLMLLGVSEQPVPVFTRNVLEKGMTMVGCSRSGRCDFERAVDLMREPRVQRHLAQIVYVDAPVRRESDIKRAFATDLATPFKTVFEWGL